VEEELLGFENLSEYPVAWGKIAIDGSLCPDTLLSEVRHVELGRSSHHILILRI
jgi:hypothetical protein